MIDDNFDQRNARSGMTAPAYMTMRGDPQPGGEPVAGGQIAGQGVPMSTDMPVSDVLLLIQHIIREKTAYRYYFAYMLEAAPSEEEEKLLLKIRNDFMYNLDAIERLYYELAGTPPPPIVAGPYIKPESYCDGLRSLILTGEDLAVFYRQILYAMDKREHINLFAKILTDVYKDTGLLNYMYAKNGCKD